MKPTGNQVMAELVCIGPQLVATKFQSGTKAAREFGEIWKMLHQMPNI
jgi:hypothetical protein